MGWLVSGPVGLSQAPSVSPAPTGSGTNLAPIFRFDPEPRSAAHLDVVFVDARETFLQRLAKEYHAAPLSILELTAPRFQQFVKDCQTRDPSFPLTAELAVHWASGHTGEPLLKNWARELTKKQFICATNLPTAALAGTEVRVLTNQIDASAITATLEEQSELIPRAKLWTLSQAREDLLSRFEAQKEVGTFLAGFLVENCAFDPQLTENIRAKREVPVIASSETATPAVSLEPSAPEAAPSETQQELLRASERIDAQIKAALRQLSELEVQNSSASTSPPAPEVLAPVALTNDIAASVPSNLLRARAVPQAIAATPSIDRLFDLSGLMLVMSLMVLWLCLRFMSSKESSNPAPPGSALTAFASAVGERDAEESIAVARSALVPKFMEWLRSRGVQQLIVQREELRTTQQLAEMELAKLEQMLSEVQAPIQERLLAYEERIAGLEERLRLKVDENQELIEAMVRSTRKKMEAEKQASSGANWGSPAHTA